MELIDPAKGTLHATVGPQVNASETFPVAFTMTKNTYGTFAFQGDAVTWSVPSITRQNLTAWYVYTGQWLFINLGAYDYGTPANCADKTVGAFRNPSTMDVVLTETAGPLLQRCYRCGPSPFRLTLGDLVLG